MRNQTHLAIAIILLLIGGAPSGCGESSDVDVEYVALGASDATGVGATPITNGYVFLLEGRIESTGLETDLFNLGIPGAMIDDIHDIALPLVEEAKPNLVTLFTGINDLVHALPVADFETDLNSILSNLRSENPEAFIVVGSLPPIELLPKFISEPDPDVTTASVAAYNEVIFRVAAANGVAVADMRDIDSSGDFTDDDGFHPNDEGHRRIADEFWEVIEPNIAAFTPSN